MTVRLPPAKEAEILPILDRWAKLPAGERLKGGTKRLTKPAHTTPPPDAASRRRAPPVLTYSVEQMPSFDAAFYNRARAEPSKVAELTVPPRDAKAFEVAAGHFFRIVSVEGPQVGDLNLWNAHDLTERFYSGKTLALHETHLSLFPADATPLRASL